MELRTGPKRIAPANFVPFPVDHRAADHKRNCSEHSDQASQSRQEFGDPVEAHCRLNLLSRRQQRLRSLKIRTGGGSNHFERQIQRHRKPGNPEHASHQQGSPTPLSGSIPIAPPLRKSANADRLIGVDKRPNLPSALRTPRIHNLTLPLANAAQQYDYER